MALTDPYQVITVERSTSPRGGSGDEWCRYVVANKRSRIAGRRCGTPSQVRQHAEGFANDLNARVNGRSLWAPRSRQKPQGKPSSENALSKRA